MTSWGHWNAALKKWRFAIKLTTHNELPPIGTPYPIYRPIQTAHANGLCNRKIDISEGAVDVSTDYIADGASDFSSVSTIFYQTIGL